MVEELLKVRSEIKKRKPTYKRQQSNQYAKFKNKDNWRRPKGLQSKVRLKRAGHQGMPEIGFKSPKLVRGLSREGLREVIVQNVTDLQNLNIKEEIAVLGRTVGSKKRLSILQEAKKLKIRFANIKDIDAKIKDLTKEPKKKDIAKSNKAKTKAEPKESNKEDSKVKEVKEK